MLNPKKFAHFLEDRAAKKDGYIMCAIGQDPKTLRDWYFIFLLQINTQKVVLIRRHHLSISLIMSTLMMKAEKRLQMYGLMR